MIYTINVGPVVINDTTYPGRCLSAGIGGSGIESSFIPWEGTENNPWDYKYIEGSFIYAPIAVGPQIPEPTAMDRLEAQQYYTAVMTDTLLED